MTTRLRISRDWVYALGFGALGLILRLWNLDSPKGKIFDEIYYATNAQSLLQNGVEIDSKSGLAQLVSSYLVITNLAGALLLRLWVRFRLF